MAILPGLLTLVVFILTRPFEFFPALQGLPFLYVFFGLAVLGLLSDLGQRRTEWQAGPHLPWALALLAWAVLTVLFRDRSILFTAGLKLSISVALYFLIAHGIDNFRSFSRLTGVILGCMLLISAVCTHQGLQPFQCVGVDPHGDPNATGTPDGRSCADWADCAEDPPDSELDYRCEHVGVLGTTSIGEGRVRYLGVLHDPNEVALAVSIGMPIAIARYQRRRSLRRLVVLCLGVLLAGATVILSQSRGGQLVFLTVLGVYFVNRFRWKGLLVGLLLGLPVLLWGGRVGSEAESSSSERLECAMAGIDMFKESPLFGVGYTRFVEYHTQTAHNSYVLAPAELGVVGMVAWIVILWISAKICLAGIKITGSESDEIRVWSLALLSSYAGLAVGVAFLSFNYHNVLWIFFGLSGALHATIARAQPGWRVRVRLREVVLLAAINLAILAFLYLYIRIRGI